MQIRSKILALCLFEGAKMITEAEEAMSPPAAPTPGSSPAAPPPNAPVDASQPPGGSTGAPVGVDGAPLTVESMVDRLNVIRGGKSFSDPEVFGRLTTLWKTLPSETVINIDKVLTEIGKVVINSPDSAQPDPATMQPAQSPQTQQPPMTQGAPPPAAAAAPAAPGV